MPSPNSSLAHRRRKGGGPLARSGEATPDDLRGSSHILAWPLQPSG